MSSGSNDVEIQRRYYAETANAYDEMHVHRKDEHFFALSFLIAMLDFLEIRSVLDVGSGTGRAVSHIRKVRPDIRVIGIEPVPELREIGHRDGLPTDVLIDGDATQLSFDNGSFDLVCAFGMLHHVKHADRVIAEMLRVSSKAILISDSNNFGQGSRLARALKQTINTFGLWKFANLIKTRGKGYNISEGDGLSYSYSVFNNYKQIRKRCARIHLLNSTDADINPYRTAGAVALLGVKV